MDPVSLAILLGGFLVLGIFMSRSNRKARERMEQHRKEVVVVGNDVMTTAGFYGTIVDIDGDAITLASPSGDETVWDRRAISQIASLPLAGGDEDSAEGVEDAAEESTDVVEELSDVADEPAAADDDKPGYTSPFSN